ncbi:MAG: hypothetical protein V4510_11275 [bacterium]
MRWPLPVVLVALLAAGLAGCGGQEPATADADGDGLFDNEEVAGWDIEVDTPAGHETRHVTSDPGLADTDSDGIDDHYEFLLGLDAHSNDTDVDGLTDCQESRHSVRAQCDDPSYHGATDGGTGTLALQWDTDLDGLPDGLEVGGFTVKLPNGDSRIEHTDPARGDTDSDFLPDGKELRDFHSDPLNPDTDGDGCKDGQDPVPLALERYSLKPGNITLRQAAHVRLRLLLAGTVALGGGDGGQAVPAGTTDLSGMAVPAVRPTGCTTTPTAPWVTVSVLVEDAGSGQPRLLDTFSGNPGGSAQAYWNVATGTMSWKGDGAAPAAGPFHWSGADGDIFFVPLLAAGQTT